MSKKQQISVDENRTISHHGPSMQTEKQEIVAKKDKKPNNTDNIKCSLTKQKENKQVKK